MAAWREWRGQTEERVSNLTSDVQNLRDDVKNGFNRQSESIEHLHICMEEKFLSSQATFNENTEKRSKQFEELRLTVVRCIALGGGFLAALQLLLIIWNIVKSIK